MISTKFDQFLLGLDKAWTVQVKRDGDAILMSFPKEMNINKGQNVKRRIKRWSECLGNK